MATAKRRVRKLEVDRAYHHGDLRRALIESALAIVAEQDGSRTLTLREVARHAGVSHAAPYRHFRDKRALLTAVADEGFRMLRRTILEARRRAGDDPKARFVATGLAYLDFIRMNEAHALVMFGPDVAKGDDLPLQLEANETFQVMKATITDCRGEHEPVEAQRRLGTIVWALAHGIALLSTNGQIPASVGAKPDDLLREGLGVLFETWRTAPRRARRRRE